MAAPDIIAVFFASTFAARALKPGVLIRKVQGICTQSYFIIYEMYLPTRGASPWSLEWHSGESNPVRNLGKSLKLVCRRKVIRVYHEEERG